MAVLPLVVAALFLVLGAFVIASKESSRADQGEKPGIGASDLDGRDGGGCCAVRRHRCSITPVVSSPSRATSSAGPTGCAARGKGGCGSG